MVGVASILIRFAYLLTRFPSTHHTVPPSSPSGTEDPDERMEGSAAGICQGAEDGPVSPDPLLLFLQIKVPDMGTLSQIHRRY